MKIVLYWWINCPSEITNLEHSKTIQYVLRLDIPMNDTIRVQVANSTNYLSEIVAWQFLCKICFLSDLSKEASIGGKLQQQIYLLFIIKKPIHFEDIWMVRIHLDLDLLDQLRFHLWLFQLFFVYHFYSHCETTFYISPHIDISKSAFT